MKKQYIVIFVLIVMLVVLFGCKQEQKTGQQEGAEEETECEVVNRVGIYALPGDYELDHPQDLVAYFDSLCREGAYVATHTDEKEDSLAVWDAIRLLDRFAQRKGKFYPATQIRNALEMNRLIVLIIVGKMEVMAVRHLCFVLLNRPHCIVIK